MKKAACFFALVIFVLIAYASFTLSRSVMKDQVEIIENMVVLDAGHGGSDPGKVGTNGILEKDINLSIVRKIQERLEKEKIQVILTRENDVRLNDKGETFSKSEDMIDRVNIMNELRPDMVVSIHQNSYTSPEIKGAQVFYYEHSEQSRKMAEIIQKELKLADSSNTRSIKSNKTYYLLKKTEVPALIVECGFLSNPQEAELLATDEYQNRMADAIAEGIKSCLVMAED